MLFFVVHRLGGSRKSAREVGASRLFCFTAGFSGSPNGIRFQAGWRHSLPVHNPTKKTVSFADGCISDVNRHWYNWQFAGTRPGTTCYRKSRSSQDHGGPEGFTQPDVGGFRNARIVHADVPDKAGNLRQTLS
jgi:hypothetical protein